MKTLWPCCPACKKDHDNLAAFDGHQFDWQTITCDCAHTYQIRFTHGHEFETRPLNADATLPHHFPLPGGHVGQEL